MDAREQRGLIIAATQKLVQKGQVWLVRSQAGDGHYTVSVNQENPFCSCPDHETTGGKCKHIFAVEYTVRRERTESVGGNVEITESITFTKKTSYPQVWPAYNKAQAMEKARFQVLLADLCRNVEDVENGPRPGPRSHSTRDQIFAIVFKVYSGFSSRRFSTDLKEAYEKGHTSTSVLGMKVTQYHQNPAHTPILIDLIQRSAAPLKAVETDFAVDSSGFSSSKFLRWYDEKYGITRQKSVWVKCHIACGVKTNVITAVRILDKDAGDSPQFKALVDKTAETFTVNEVSGDKAYSSQENFEAVAGVGGTGFMAFKSNTTGGIGGLFEKMFHYSQFQREDFLKHYHKRSNVESTFSMIKRKFGDSVRSKTDTAMVNEVLCKLLCHNLCCLIQEQEELGISPVFWKDEEEGTEQCNVLRFPTIA
jgi:transposase/predicted nucleic acid-binding Zn finger protein